MMVLSIEYRVLSVPWINPPKSRSDEITRLSPPPAAWHLGARIADLLIPETALGLRAGRQRKGPDPVRRSDWAPFFRDPKIPLDSCHPTVLRTHRLPGTPAPLASPRANIPAMPRQAWSSPSLSLSSSCAGIHPMQIATHTLSYIAIANIRNVPDMDSISIFCGYLWVKGIWYLKSTTASTSE